MKCLKMMNKWSSVSHYSQPLLVLCLVLVLLHTSEVNMKVYMLVYVPYGAPAHDVDIVAVFDTLKKAKVKRKELVDAEDYEARELCLIDKKVA